MESKIRQSTRPDFIRQGRAVAFLDHEVFIAVKQLNMDVLEAEALRRSTPGNADYRKWMTVEEINAIRGNAVGRQAIADWLTANGVEITWTAATGTYMKAKTTIGHWEHLLQTTFHMYEDQKTQHQLAPIPRADRYFLPSAIREHVHAFFDVSELPARITGTPYVAKKSIEIGFSSGGTNSFYLRKLDTDERTGLSSRSSAATGSALSCTGYSTIQCLNQVYDVASNIGSSIVNQSVFTTNEESFSPSDLTAFQTAYQCQIQPAISVGGHDINTCNTGTGANQCFEGNLDIQYIMCMAQATTATYYYVPTAGSPFVTFLQDLTSLSEPYHVNSMSYGSREQDLSAAMMDSFNNEAIVLAAAGSTLLAASGDDGVSGSSCECSVDSSSVTLSYAAAGGASYSGTGYFPSFPATSPYVTAVGATNGPQSNNPEIACASTTNCVITSGGGFSTYYAAPSWQTQAISAFFNNTAADGNTPSSGYNPQGRGYPDVSLLGADYPVIINGLAYSMYGTSASAPVFAAFVSLLNAARLENNLTTIGWLNPTLYAAGNNGTFANSTTAIFNDITSGANKCCASQVPADATCCTSGFTTTTGWDPVTGWGSITFPNLAGLFNVTVASIGDTPPNTDPTGSGSSSGSQLPLAIIAICAAVVAGIIIAVCVRCAAFNKEQIEPVRHVGAADNGGIGVVEMR